MEIISMSNFLLSVENLDETRGTLRLDKKFPVVGRCSKSVLSV